MTDPADYDVAFKMIGTAGNAKSESMLAIRAAREGNLAETAEILARADESLHEAHKLQTGLITQEARGNSVVMNVILVHAQDHLTGALLMRDLATEFVLLYEELAALRGTRAVAE